MRSSLPRMFECTVPGLIFDGVEYSNTIFAMTASKARYQCYLALNESWEIPIQKIRVRVGGGISMPRLAAFAETAQRRGLPFARIGMNVEVEGKRGWITDRNDSANFEVLFEDGSHGNCHPHWKMKYFSKSGHLIYDSSEPLKEFPE